MVIIRIIFYPFTLLSAKFRRNRVDFDFDMDPDRKQNPFIQFKNEVLGRIYYWYQRLQENLRVRRYNKQNRLKEEGIAFQLARIGRSMIFYLLLTIALSVIVDGSLSYSVPLLHLPDIKYFRVPDVSFITDFLKVSIGAISALLGLIFALYAVGFQMTTEKYSSEVIDYINSELVGNFFFKLLIFTDLFLLYALVVISFTDFYPIFTFLLSLTLISLSIVGIIIFKNHYLTVLKPKSLFSRILGDARAAIQVASDRSKSNFNSISVIYNVRDKLSNHIAVAGSLFQDLRNSGNWEDVVYAPMVLSVLLTDYLKRKKYIDRERDWWFFSQQREARADNSTMFVLKMNYELQGTGPLSLTLPNTEWVEDQIYSLFQKFNQEVDASKERNNFVLQLIKAYQTILFGDYEKDRNGRYFKSVIGAYDNQEFQTFDKFLRLFSELFSRLDLSDPEVVTAYTNAYFAISQSVLNGFDTDLFEKELRSLIGSDSRLAKAKSQVQTAHLPSLFYTKLNDYYDRLEVEQILEGKILTPIDLLVAETTFSLKEEEAKRFFERIKILADSQEELARALFTRQDYKALASIIRLRLDWFSRLFYLKKYDVADEYSYLIPKVAIYILYLPKEIILELDLQLQIEKIIFIAAIEQKKKLFKELTVTLVLLLTVLNVHTGDLSETEQLEAIKRNRILVIVGAFVFLVSEFEQNKDLLIEYVQIAEKGFADNAFPKIIKAMSEVKELGGLSLELQLINSEITRYPSWFAMVHQKIDVLPKTYDEVPHYSGLQEVADHPSKFIREISYDLAFQEDTIIEAFAEWVLKREQIQKLINILNKKYEK